MKKFLFSTVFILFFFGLKTCFGQNNTLKRYTNTDGFISNSITNITQDSIGNIWFSTNKGISSFDGDNITNYTTNDSLISNKVTIIKPINDSLLIGTAKGLSIKKQHSFYNYECKKINTIIKNKNTIFVGTDLGIYFLKEDYLSRLKINQAIDLSKVNQIIHHNNFFWIATSNGLWKLDSIKSPQKITKVINENFTALLVYKNTLLASTYNNGTYQITKNKKRLITNTPRQVTSIKEINNNIWISTKNEGIEVLNNDFLFEKKINKYNTLHTDRINTVFQDNQQNTWIATQNKGIYKFENTKAKQTTKPKIRFSNIEVVYTSLDSIPFNNYTETLQLAPNKNHISFSFKTVNINNPKKILYRYSLNGNQSKWSKKNSVDFANLQPGNYTFSVQSKTNNNLSNLKTFRFFIDTPLYKKLWFQISVLSLLVLLSSLLVYRYIAKIRAKNKARVEKLQLDNYLLSLEQKALQLQMNPHFIFNVLNGIKALATSNKNTSELNSTINTFATLLRSVLTNSRKEEVSLTQEIVTLKSYIELEQQMSVHKFSYDIETQISFDADEVLIPPMLIQPFIENSIKHGIKSVTNGKLFISFKEYKNFLHCTITDNGIGYKQSQRNKEQKSHNSLAVKVTKERINNLSGNNSFTIKETKENGVVTGTKVWFKLPLKTDF